jgi:hypothetical protein
MLCLPSRPDAFSALKKPGQSRENTRAADQWLTFVRGKLTIFGVCSAMTNGERAILGVSRLN